MALQEVEDQLVARCEAAEAQAAGQKRLAGVVPIFLTYNGTFCQDWGDTAAHFFFMGPSGRTK